MNLRQYTAGALTSAAAVLGASGCGGPSCPTETPAKVDAIGSCTAKPNDTVPFPIRLCPTCNQTGATCQVDLSAVASSGDIQLDPTVQACESVSTCSSPGTTCQANPLTCSFRAPAAEGRYTVLVFDPASGQTLPGTLDVSASVSSGCSI